MYVLTCTVAPLQIWRTPVQGSRSLSLSCRTLTRQSSSTHGLNTTSPPPSRRYTVQDAASLTSPRGHLNSRLSLPITPFTVPVHLSLLLPLCVVQLTANVQTVVGIISLLNDCKRQGLPQPLAVRPATASSGPQ